MIDCFIYFNKETLKAEQREQEPVQEKHKEEMQSENTFVTHKQ